MTVLSDDSLKHATPPRAPISRWVAPLFALATVIVFALSPGYREADEINHFLIARQALYESTSRIDVWGRPGCTLLFAPFTPLGLAGARMFGGVLTLLVGFGTVRLARLLFSEGGAEAQRDSAGGTVWLVRHRDAFLWLLLFAQTCFLVFSASVMTEMLLALAWVWGAVFLARRRILLASLCIGLGGLGRPEGFFAIAAWPVFLLLLNHLKLVSISWKKNLAGTFLAGLPVLMWYLAGVLIYGYVFWVKDHWPWAVKSQYPTNAGTFLWALFQAAWWMWLPVGIAMVYCFMKRMAWPAMLLVLPLLGFILLHGILGSFALFGSAAYSRYFICVAPLIAILCFWGCQLLAARLPRSDFINVYAAGMLLVGCALPIAGVWKRGEIPTPLPADGLYINALMEALPSIVPPDQWPARVIAFNPYARYRLNIHVQDQIYFRSKDRNYLEHAPIGTVVISDDDLCKNEGLPQAADFYDWGYTLDPKLQDHINAAYKFTPYMHVYVWFKRW